MLFIFRTAGKRSYLAQSFCFIASLATLVLSLSMSKAAAQSATTGAIAGTVTDSGGALLPATTVTVKSPATGFVRTVKSNASGEYRVVDLEPGTYTASFTADGFETYQETAIVVSVGSISAVSAVLKVGSVTNTVEVTDQTPLMHTQDSAISTTIDQNAIDNLPINGRRWSNFALLTPGVVSNSDGFGLLSFRGISVLLNNSTVDGADNNQAYFSEERGRTRASYSVSQSAVQEFQVNASNYSAEYGRAAGGVINTVTKSGTNQFHGELFFYDRDNDFGAENPYTLLTTQVAGSNNFITYPYKPKDWRKQWGFGIGGPLLHDKLFWFYSYDQSQRNFPGTGRASDPTDTFSPADAALPVGTTCSTSTLSYGDQAACNISSALFLGSYQAGAAYYTQGLGIISSVLGYVPRHSDQVLNFPRLDYQINDRNRVTAQYNRLRYSSPAGVQTQASNFLGKSSFGNDFVKEDFGILRASSVLTSSLVNNFLFQYGRDFEYETSQKSSPNEAVLNQTIPSDPLAPAAPPDTQIGFSFDFVGFDIGRVYFLERRALPSERRMQGEDMVTWSHGAHTAKAGLEVNRVFDYIDNLYQEGGSYSYDHSWEFIADYLHTTTGLGGASYAPKYFSFSQGFGNPRIELATTDYAGFLTDDWRVTPRLTVTLGLRYEYEYVPANPVPNTTGSPYNPTIALAVPQTLNRPDDRNNVGPRVGFAYNLYGNGNTTLRGGYGMYYGRIVNSNIIQSYLLSGGKNSQIDIQATQSSNCIGLLYPQIFATVNQFTAACSGAGGYASTIAFLDKRLQNPQIHEIDLALEQNMGHNTVFSMSYMGSFGRELAAAVDQNVSSTNIASRNFQVVNNVVAPPTYITYPHGGNPPPLLPGSVHTYKEYTTAGSGYGGYYHVLEFKSQVNSSYHALAVSVNHRYSNNFSLLSNFTWAHALDFNPYLSTGYGTSSELLDPLNPGGEYATSSLNVKHRFVIAGTYRTNFGGLTSWKKEAFNGWGFAPIFQAQTGLPYSAGLNGSISGSLYGGVLGVGGTARIPDLGRNTYTMPKTAVVDMRVSKSFALYRGNDRYRFEIIAEAFNLLNHQNITSVNTTAYCIENGNPANPGANSNCLAAQPGTYSAGNYLAANPRFGTYQNSNSNTLLTPRQLQIAGRFYF
jgi:Carboxypeptidase regulatory-like domain/TonB dependent receptor